MNLTSLFRNRVKSSPSLGRKRSMCIEALEARIAPAVLVSTTQAFVIDADADGVADPGDRIHYTVTIQNTGPTDVTGMTFEEIINDANLTLVANSINVSPLAVNDAFSAVGNTQLLVGNASSVALPGAASVVAGGVVGNDTEFLGDSFVITGFQSTSLNGGTVNMVTTGADRGAFSYLPAVGFTGTDTFTYTLTDDGIDGTPGNADDLTGTGTVTITVSEVVWYVDDSAAAGGTGRSNAPFQGLQPLTSGGAADGTDNADDFIYVYAGNYAGAAGRIALEGGQRLVGEGSALVVGNLSLPAGTAPVLAPAAGTAVTLGNNNTLMGFTVGASQRDIASEVGTPFGTLTVSDVTLNGSGKTLDLTNGTFAAGSSFISIASTGTSGLGAQGHGMQLINVGGSVSFGSTGIMGSEIQGIFVNNSTANINFGNTSVQTISAAGVEAIRFETNTVGTRTFGTLTVNGITGTNAPGINFGDTSGSVLITGPASLSNIAGNALNVSGGASVNFQSALNIGVAAAVGGAGISLSAHNAAFTTVSGTIQSVTGNDVSITGGTGAVTIAQTITNTAARSVNVVNRTTAGAGAVNFTGPISDTGTGILLDNNDTSTVNFSGGLTLATTTNTAFSAINGGTVNVTGATNTITTTTATALNIAGTNIGASNVTFQSISSDGGTATGIILDTTGSSGGLRVTGNPVGAPTAGSGGTIANKTGADGATTTGNGIYLNSTSDVRLAGMQLNDFQNSAIRGLSVSGFKFEDSVISGVVGNSTAVIEGAIAFGDVLAVGTAGLTGNSLIDNVNISGSIEHHLEFYNQTGTMNLTITNSSIHDNSLAGGADGIQMEFRGNAQAFVNIDGNTFTNNKSQAIQIGVLEDANVHATISSNTITRGTQGNEGIVLSNGGNSDLTVLIGGPNVADGNTISGFGGVGIFVGQVPGQGSAASLLQATIQSNTVTSPATATNHAILALVSSLTGQVSQTRLLIDSNTVNYASAAARAILVDAPDAGRSPEFYATVTNNLVTATDINAVTMISVAARNGSIGHSDIRGNDVNYTTAVGITGINVREATLGSNVLARGGSASNDSAVVLAANNPSSTTTVIPSAADIPVVENNTILLPATPTLPIVPLLFVASAGDVIVPPLVVLDDVPVVTPPLVVDEGTPVVVQPPVIVDDGVLSQAELDSLVSAAIARWTATGLSAAQVSLLQNVSFTVEDLPGWYLGSAGAGVVTLDSNAAGNSWFIDATPLEDGEFAGAGTQLSATANGGASGRVDALTTVMHELGHQLGLEDSYSTADSADIMYGRLHQGERRLPAFGEANGAVPGAHLGEGPDFLFGAMNIGTLPNGKTLTVVYDATVDALAPGFVPANVSSQVRVKFDTAQQVDGNLLTTPLDSLSLGNLVWRDANQNGLFEPADLETGVDGVGLNLYIDDGDGALDAGDTFIASTTTAGGGIYNFIGLAPGNYIVEVSPVNFEVGGALGGALSSAGGPGPDNNVDNDDNGAPVAGFGVASSAITLAFNTEPTAGNGNDTNDTLDFGFFFATLTATLTAGNLTIADVGGVINSLTAIQVGTDLVITDATEIFQAAPAGGALSNGGRTLTIPLASVTGSLTINTAGGSDSLVLDLSGGDFINAAGVTFNGGESAGDNDRLTITGYSLTTADGIADVTLNHTGVEDGNVALTGLGNVFFTQIEPLSLAGNQADLFINLPAGPNAATILSDDGGAGDPDGNTENTSAIDDATFEYTQFRNPSNLLAINAGSATDFITVQDLVVSGFTASLRLGTAGAAFGTAGFTGAVALGASSTLSVLADSVFSSVAGTLSAGGDITLEATGATSEVQLSGHITKTAGADATLTIRSAFNITFANSIDVISSNNRLNVILNSDRDAAGTGAISLGSGNLIDSNGGDITLGGGANPATTPAIGNVNLPSGILLTNAQITSGAGAVSLNGQGAVGGAADNFGVLISASGGVQTTSGSITIIGQGGTGGASGNGVAILGSLQVTSASGNINITGTGGTSTGGNAVGIVMNTATVSTAGAGTVTFVGTGGSGSAIDRGVELFNNAVVQVENGAMSITGTATSANNAGVRLSAGTSGRLLSTGSGPITVTGTGFGTGNGFEAGASGIVGGGTATGDINIIADRIDLAGSLNVQTTATVTLRQKTNAVGIDLGGADGAVLGLTDAELDRINAATVQVGDANSGAITITQVLSPANHKTLAIGNAASFTATGGFDSEFTSATIFEKITVAGAVVIDPAAAFTATAIGGFVPAASDNFVVINNLSAGTTTGTFAGKPEGTDVLLGGVNKKITYLGGTGNDVVLIGTTVEVTVGAPTSTLENGAGLVYTFTRVGDTALDLPVSFNVGGSAALTADYTAASAATGFTFLAGSGTITIPAGLASITLTLTPVNDALVEGDEAAVLTVVAGGAYAPTGIAASGTITDNDTATISFTTGTGTALESAGTQNISTTLTITANGTGTIGLASAITLDLTSTGGTATGSGTDYTLPGTPAVTFAAGTYATGTATQNAVITIINDRLVEGDETAALGLAIMQNIGSQVSIGATNAHTLTLTDNDTATIGFTAGASGVLESAVTHNVSTTLTINANGTGTIGLASNFTANLTTSGGTATGTGTDYTLPGSPAVTFLATGDYSSGTATQTAAVTIIDDRQVEGSETAVLGLGIVGNIGSQVTIGGTTAHTVTISDNDTANISFTAGTSTALESAGTHNVSTTLTINTIGTGTIGLASNLTINLTTTGGTATGAGTDYTLPGTPAVTYAAGNYATGTATQNAAVTIIDDRAVEGSETAQIGLGIATNIGNQVTLGVTTAHTLTITDNDTATIGYSAAASSIGEGAGTAPLGFVLTIIGTGTGTPVLERAVVVNTTTAAGGTATGIGTDYTLPGPVVFAANSPDGASQTANLSITNDAFVEGNETANIGAVIGIDNTGGQVTIAAGAAAIHSVTITDNDTATISFTTATSTIGEGAGNAPLGLVLTITANGTGAVELARNVTFNVTTAAGGTATGAGTDYTLPVLATFSAGAANGATQNANLAIVNDALVEGSETANLGATIATDLTGGQVSIAIGAAATHVTTITDNDTATIGYTTTTSTIGEAAGNDSLGLVLTITANGTGTPALARDVTFNVTTTGGTATGGGTDYTLPVLATFAAGTLSGITLAADLAIINDALVEGTETANLGLAIGTDGTGGQVTIAGGPAASHATTITDNDTATLSIQPTRTHTEQGGAQTVTVTLTTSDGAGGTATLAPGITITADTIDVGGGSALSGSDYTAFGTQTVSFGPGSVDGATTTVTLAVLEDLLSEGSETVSLGLLNLTGPGLLGNTASTVTILDNDIDLTVTKIESIATVVAGSGTGNLIYTITVRNNGLLDATGVTLGEVLTLPTGVTIDSIVGSNATTFADTTWTVGSLAIGASETLTVTLTVGASTAEGTDTISDTATVLTADQTLVNTGDDSATEATSVDRQVDLVITKTDGETILDTGDTATYTITYNNVGPSDATGVVLTETVPTGTTFVSSGSTLGWTETAPGSGIYTLAVGTVVGGTGTGTAIFIVRVNDTVAAGLDNIVNTASIADDTTAGADLDTDDNTATDTDTLDAAPDLAVTKTADVTQIQRGGTITYTITYSNIGDQDATGVTLVETVPANSFFVSGAGWTASGMNTYTFNVGALAAGETAATITFVVRTNDGIPATVRNITNNIAIGDGGINGADPDTSNNTFTRDTQVYQGIYVVAPGHQADEPTIARTPRGDAGPVDPAIRVFDVASGAELFQLNPYTGDAGVRVAVGDFNGDGFDDIVTTKRAGNGNIRIFDGRTGTPILINGLTILDHGTIRSTNGVFVAAGDINGDGHDDIVIGGGLTGSKVKVIDGTNGTVLNIFKPFTGGYKNGVRVALGDVNGDGRDDIITSQNGGGSTVKVFDGTTIGTITPATIPLFTFNGGGSTGVSVAAGDVNGDGIAEIITGSNPATSGSPGKIKIFNPVTGLNVGTIAPLGGNFFKGIRVAAADVDLDGFVDIIAASGPNAKSKIEYYSGADRSRIDVTTAFPDLPTTGVFVAGTTPFPAVFSAR